MIDKLKSQINEALTTLSLTKEQAAKITATVKTVVTTIIENAYKGLDLLVNLFNKIK